MIEQGKFSELVIDSWLSSDGGDKNIEEIMMWIDEKNKVSDVQINPINLSDSKSWYYEEKTGMIRNQNSTFFQITGLVDENYAKFQQPIIIQDEIGYLGIICKKINGILCFLMQAKIEPGNVNCIQVSPTIQATLSNFTQKHGGRKPLYIDYFMNYDKYHVIVDQIQSEQSSRFFKKRNRNTILYMEENENIECSPNHCWMTLGQIKHLMKFDNIVNMDTRTVISCLPFKHGDVDTNFFENDSRVKDYDLLRSIFSQNVDLVSVFKNINDEKMFNTNKYRIVPLTDLDRWNMSNSGISCKDNYSFDVIYCDIRISGREVNEWDQPLFRANGKGFFGLISSVINSERNFLVQLKKEPGCFDLCEVGPTVQIEANELITDFPFGLYFSKENIGSRVLKDVILSEEGGRFYHEENRNVIIDVDYESIEVLNKSYLWVNYATLNQLIQFNNCVNIQLRNLLSLLDL